MIIYKVLFFLHLLFPPLYSLDVFIGLQNMSNLCSYSIGNTTCNGSRWYPHDNLIDVFNSTIANSSNGSTINFYLFSSSPIRLLSSLNGLSIVSPFDNFEGFY